MIEEHLLAKLGDQYVELREKLWVPLEKRTLNNVVKKDDLAWFDMRFSVREPAPFPNPDAYWGHPTFEMYLCLQTGGFARTIGDS